MSGDIVFRAGECLDVFGAEPDASFDAFVCDWPAGVSFMSRGWDTDKGGRAKWIAYWAERAAMMKRKAKPGAYALVWALPRTSHWTATALEDGGWFVQDVITHVFGQGWPKGRAALKPASEHWILARNGSGGVLQIDAARVARGAQDWPEDGRPGGHSAQPDALKISGAPPGDGIRCPPGGSWPPNFALSHCPECEERGTRMVASGNGSKDRSRAGSLGYGGSIGQADVGVGFASADGTEAVPAFDCLASCPCGATVLAASGGEPPRCVCGSAMEWACPVAQMDQQSGERPGFIGFAAGAERKASRGAGGYGGGFPDALTSQGHGDSGGASRFFPRFHYVAKSASAERHAGCDDLLWRADKRSPFGFVRVSRAEWEALPEDVRAQGNVHPTVKSLDMMRRWVALVAPPGGRIGDITGGSGGTGIATHMLNVTRDLGASFLGCDICPEAIEIAEARLAWWREHTAQQRGLFGEHEAVITKPERPAKARAGKVDRAAETDPRQRGLF